MYFQRASWSVLASQLYLVSYTFAGYNIVSLPAGVEILKLCKSLKKAFVFLDTFDQKPFTLNENTFSYIKLQKIHSN